MGVSFESRFSGCSLPPITDTQGGRLYSNFLAVDFPDNVGKDGGGIVNAYITIATGVKSTFP